MNNRNIIFRCDGSSEIGMGHIVGSMRFSQLLRKELNINPVFLIKENDKVMKYLYQKNIHFETLPTTAGVDAQLEKIQAISKQYNTQIITFNFNADELFLWGNQFSVLKESGFTIVFQDNPMDSFRFGDVVINALPHPEYEGYKPSEYPCCFDGLEYLLLDESFHKYRSLKIETKDDIERILIAFGGSDHQNITSIVLKALNENNCSAYIDVVIGSASKHIEQVQNLAQNLDLNVGISTNVSDMSERIWKADVGFSSLGLTTYEMAALSLPCFIIAPHKLNAVVAKIYCEKYPFAQCGGLIHALKYDEMKGKIENFISKNNFNNKAKFENIVIGNLQKYKKIIAILKGFMK